MPTILVAPLDVILSIGVVSSESGQSKAEAPIEETHKVNKVIYEEKKKNNCRLFFREIRQGNHEFMAMRPLEVASVKIPPGLNPFAISAIPKPENKNPT